MLEQLKKCERQDKKLHMMQAALNDIITAQQDMFDFLKPGRHWNELFDTIESINQLNKRSDLSFDSSSNNGDAEKK